MGPHAAAGVAPTAYGTRVVRGGAEGGVRRVLRPRRPTLSADHGSVPTRRVRSAWVPAEDGVCFWRRAEKGRLIPNQIHMRRKTNPAHVDGVYQHQSYTPGFCVNTRAKLSEWA
jgi:hypothetical protein